MSKRKLVNLFVDLERCRRPSRRVRRAELTGLELLDRRVLPAVTASFSAAAGLLRVTGDAQDNTIVVSRDAGGTILVNDGAVAIEGDLPATLANTHMIMMVGAGGNDNLSLDETNGAMPAASLFGGDGNDVLTGGDGNDFVDGGAGNDLVFLGPGDDTFQWNPGNGSDTVDGQGGTDTMVFNGSDAAEKFDISDSDNGLPVHRVRLTRDVGNVAMDLNGVEEIELNANGGADTITVNDLSATDLLGINLDLNGSTRTGDGQDDVVIINGTNEDDFAQIAAFDNGTRIGASVGSFPVVNIAGAEGTNDVLEVNALGGNDVVDASNLTANLIGLELNGGAGNDLILGSPGDDLVNGGPGNDVLQMGDGRDTSVWNPGDGSDTVDGQSGSDRLVFNGSDTSEKVDISASGNRIRLTRDVGAIAMDLSGIETIDVNANGGADALTVNDTSAADLSVVNLNLAGSLGRGDGQSDAVIVNATNGDEKIQVLPFGSGTRIAVLGLFPRVNIVGADGTNDHLTVNALGGNDVVDASNLPANLIGLTVNLGDGQAAATTTTLRTSTAIAVSGQSVILSATVSSMTGTPTGTVTFMDGKVVVGTAAVGVDGTATISTSFVGPGVHAVTAVYSGDRNFVSSSSTVTEQVIAPTLAATRTSLFTAAHPARRRHPVVFRATVHGHEGVSSPTGTVTFMVGNVTVAQVKLDGNDQARWTGRFSSRGRFTVRAIYSGDGNFSSSSSSLTERIVGTRS